MDIKSLLANLSAYGEHENIAAKKAEIRDA
jgi:hypothetical protein